MYKTKGIPNTRIEIADALRGIAVMGIIIFHCLENFNIFLDDKSMALPTDDTVFSVCEILLSSKMYGIFAMLFGVSFFIMRDNQEQKGRDFSLRFAWRMVLLFIIGLINIFFYNGDILTSYATLGVLMIPAGYLSTRWLWAITIFLLAQPVEIYSLVTGWKFPEDELWATWAKITEANINGSFWESGIANVSIAYVANLAWALWAGRLTQTLAFFYLGILVGRHRLFYNEGNNLRIWLWVLIISFPLCLIGSNVDMGSFSVWTKPITNMLILFSEVSAIVLLWYLWKPFCKILSNVCFFGRMSLSNYLMQSVFGSVLFYGWGFKLCDDLGATWSLLVGIVMITVQIIILKQWDKNHQRGPMETLWRKLTWIAAPKNSATTPFLSYGPPFPVEGQGDSNNSSKKVQTEGIQRDCVTSPSPHGERVSAGRVRGCLLFLFLFLPLVTLAKDSLHLKPRLVVMTDIGDCDVEPDDMESAIRLMAYADMFEIEAIMTTVGWNCDPYPKEWAQYLDKVVEAYGKDVHNLMARSKQKDFLSLDKENGKQTIGYWPSMEYIKSRCMAGSHRAGIGVVGKDNDTDGSEFLIKLADEDDERPIWVATWGSGNTLAQAIWKVQQTRTPEQLKAFLHKFRVYTITDQDMVYAMRMNRAYSSHMWMRREFKDDLKFIWDEGTWQLQCELGKQEWKKHQELIQGHGALGAIYPNYKWGVEGDTPSFLYIMPNGLNDPEDPTQAGWAGCHKFGMCADSLTYAWTSWQEPQRGITEGYKRRFYPAELNDFCARMQWAKEGRGNTNPIVIINGKQPSPNTYHLTANAGEEITLDASKSVDAEGNKLSFVWWMQPEASTYDKNITINSNNASKATITIPEDAKGKTIHIVCEVTDDGEIPLTSYARVVISAM